MQIRGKPCQTRLFYSGLHIGHFVTFEKSKTIYYFERRQQLSCLGSKEGAEAFFGVVKTRVSPAPVNPNRHRLSSPF